MNCFNIINLSESEKWNEIVVSFQQYDVYYLSGYVKAFKIHGDGEPILIYYETETLRGINVVMKRDISQFAPLMSIIKPELYFDFVTPYGYGGFLFEGDTSESTMTQFYQRYVEFAKNENAISACVRYHPQLKNADSLRKVSTVVDLGKTISMDLDSTDLILANISKDCRNRIRKAKNSGIEIHHGKTQELLDDFIEMYNSTMDKNQADPYYYFEKAFYESIFTDLYENFDFFYAVLEKKIIAISLMSYANKKMHSHLVGSLSEYRNFAPSNLLLFEAACWASQQGFDTLHLGGGIGSEEDELFRFKKSFNRNSDNTFSIGKEIFNQEIYDRLVQYRKIVDVSFDCNSSFFPLYRAL